MLALSIRQPFVEEILRGIKTIEYRSKNCTMIGERFFLYAAQNVSPDEDLQRFATLCKDRVSLKALKLPTGVLVGTAVIAKVTKPTDAMPFFHWHLAEVERLFPHQKPKNHPMPSWFEPF